MKSQLIGFMTVISVVLLVVFSGCTEKEPGKETGNNSAIQPYQVKVPFGDEVSVFSFGDGGKILSQTNPGKSVGNVNALQSADAAEIKYEYDDNGRKIKTDYFDSQNAIIAQTKYEYDTSGKCIKCDVLTSENGELSLDFGFVYEYNKITDNKGMIEEYLYDENGLCVKESVFSDDTLAMETSFYYDDSNRLIKTESSSKDNCEYCYDSNGRLVKEIYDWYVVDYEYADDNTAKVYSTYEGQEKTALKLIEFFDSKRIVKESWYNVGSDTDFYAVNISLIEELAENEPNPQYTVHLK